MNDFCRGAMRIIQTCGSPSWGGLEMEAVKIADALQNRGHQVVLMCQPETQIAREAQAHSLEVVPLFRKDAQLLTSIRQLRQFLNKGEWDIIHAHLSHDLSTIVPALRWGRFSTPLILTRHMASGVSKRDPIHRWLYSRVNRILAISHFIRENVLRTCPVEASRVTTLWNGIELNKYPLERNHRADVRREFNIPQDRLVIGMVGRITPKKGHRELLKAARILINATDIPVHFLIVGGASFGEEAYEREVHALAKELSLDECLTFTGFREDVTHLMQAMDIFVFPSYKESFGVTLLEAMAMQLPVVASSTGAVPEIVVDRETGILIPPGDEDALAGGLLELLREPDLRQQMGIRGRLRVEQFFQFEGFLENLEVIYQQCMEDTLLNSGKSKTN
ncbi:MAG: glycosyltransferase family 1 protein [Calditrichaeota bacterium]|nr:MAG: glycosyltransferase family 1 protein [Calditrichota bacterium]